jgi:hypothetical protein
MKTKITLILLALICTLAHGQNVTIIPTGITPAPVPGGGWALTGNAGTNPASTDFLGTTDLQALALRTNNIERLRITDNGRVGIGLNSPRSRLHVSIASTPGTFLTTSGTVASFEGSKEAHISLLANSSYSGAINFATDLSPIQGFINYDHPKNEMVLGTNSTPKVIINNIGNVGIGQASPLATLDVNGELRLADRFYVNNTNVTFDPFLRQGKAYIGFTMSTASTVTIKGFDAPANANANGVVLYIASRSLGNVTLVHNSSTTAAGNKILTHTGADFTISGRGGATLVWDSGFWQVISVAD